MASRPPLVLAFLLLGGNFACGAPSSPPEPTQAKPARVDKTPEQKAADQKQAEIKRKLAEVEKHRAEIKTYAYQLEQLENKIAGGLQLIEKNPNATTGYKKAAAAYMARARLSGDYADYAKAQGVIEKTFGLREKVDGALMARARLNYTLHRLDRVDPDFDRAKSMPKSSKEALAADVVFAANLAMQRGRYEDAATFFGRAKGIIDNSHVKTSRAIYLWKTGHIDEADALLEATSKGFKGKVTEPVAWMHLHRGLLDLDCGRYDEAMAHYKEAQSWIQGYWLIDEHIAEVLVETGKTEEAKKLYLDVIERTNNPEFMDAMAGLMLEEGKEAEAKEYIAKAEARYEEQMAQFPEATYGHALEHYIEFGEDPKYAVELAEKNHTLRPNSEAKTLLAQAYLRAGNIKKAKKIIDKAVATPYSTIDLHLTAAEVYRAAKKEGLMNAQLEKAKAINPKAELEPLPEDEKPAEG